MRKLFLALALLVASVAQATTTDNVVGSCNGTPGTPLVLTITGGADASVTLLARQRYLVVNDAGGTVFCKAGATATVSVDAPFLDQTTRCHLFTPQVTGTVASVVYHCAAGASVTGNVYFVPLSNQG